MLLPFLSISAGIILASLGTDIYIGTLVVIFGSIIYLWLRSYRSNPVKNYRYAPLHYLWIALFFLGIGIITGDISAPMCPPYNEIENEIVVEGVVKDIRNSTSGDKMTIDVLSTYDKTGKKRNWRNFTILNYSDAVTNKIGDIIVFPIHDLKIIEDSENSFRKGFADTWNKRGIFYSVRVSGAEIKTVNNTFDPISISSNIRDLCVSFIEKQHLEKNTRVFIITILTGEKEYLDDKTRSLFSDGGISHILALSGMHIGIIAGIILFILFPLNFFGKYKLRLLLAAILLWIYAFITGMSPSIVRACIMATALIISILLERKNTALNSLCLSGFIILLFSPRDVYDVGFQLSFLCVGSLIIFAEKLNPINRRKNRRLYNVMSLILASLITSFTTWTIVGYYFHSFPTMFLPANVIVLPFIPLYVVLIVIYLLLNLIGIRIDILGRLIDVIYDGLEKIIHTLGENSSAILNVPGISVILWVIGLIVLAYLLNRSRRIYAVVLSALFFIPSIGIILFTPAEKIEKGILICNSYPEVIIKYSDGIDEENIHVPRNSISYHEIEGIMICVMDTEEIPDNLNMREYKMDYLILTGRYKGTIQSVLNSFDPDKIVTHASMRKKIEYKLLNEAEEMSIPCHSLRNDKTIRILL